MSFATGTEACASTNTLATKSPAPSGCAWQPAHEFASGAETRVKRGADAGFDVRGVPIPVVPGRPPPSLALKLVTKICRPEAKIFSDGILITLA